MGEYSHVDGHEPDFEDGILESATYLTPDGDAFGVERDVEFGSKVRYEVFPLDGRTQKVKIGSDQVSDERAESKIYRDIHGEYLEAVPDESSSSGEDIVEELEGVPSL